MRSNLGRLVPKKHMGPVVVWTKGEGQSGPTHFYGDRGTFMAKHVNPDEGLGRMTRDAARWYAEYRGAAFVELT